MIAQTANMQAVKDFMELPEIWRYCSEFGADKEKKTYTHGPKETWLAYVVDNEPVGLINMYVITGAACQFHPYIKREYAKHYDSMLKQFFKWFCENMPDTAIKLNALIPTKFRATIAAAKRVGGKLEGTDRQSYRTEKRIYDRLLFGITREEMSNG